MERQDRLDPEVVARRLAMHKRGMSFSEIAKAVGRSVSGIAKWFRRRGLCSLAVGGRPRLYFDAREIVHIRSQYEAGRSLNGVAALQGLSKGPIVRVLREQGVPIRRTGRPCCFAVDEDQKIAAEYKRGVSTQILAERYGAAAPSIRAAVRRAGGQVRRVGRPRKGGVSGEKAGRYEHTAVPAAQRN